MAASDRSHDDQDTPDDQGVVQEGHAQRKPVSERPRDGHGRFVDDPEVLQRDTEAARLRGQGWTWQAISDELGYADRSTASKAVARLRLEIITPAIEEMRDAEDAKLDQVEQACMAVLQARHLKFHDGQALTHEGELVTDDEHVLKATAQLLKIAERRARLWGLDSPIKVDHGGAVHVRYELPGVDMGKV
jgi:hypothetical protein